MWLPLVVAITVGTSLVVNASAGNGTRVASDSLRAASRITVTAPRHDPRAILFGRSGFVAMVDLSKRRDRVEDLPHVLSQLVGVRVKQYGGLGSFATVSIRGSSSSQVSVYLDGMPVNDPYLGLTNVADLGLGGVERIEVYRGFAPPHLGNSAIGGAINLVTVDPTVFRGDTWFAELDASASYGTFDTSREQVTAWFTPSRFRIKLHGGHGQSLGDFSFFDDNGTPLNPGDDATATRVNNDHDRLNMLMRVDTEIGNGGKITAVYDEFRQRNGVPGLGVNQSATARTESGRRVGYLTFDTGPPWRQVRFSGASFYSRSRERFRDIDGDISLTRQDSDNRVDVYGARGHARWLVPGLPATIDASFENRKEQFHPASRIPEATESPDRWRRANTTALTGEAYLLGDRAILSVTQRWERYRAETFEDPAFPWLPPAPTGLINGNARTPSAGIRVQPVPWLVVKGNVGRYTRLPTFLEMFGNVGSVTGNAGLVAEEGTNRDMGVVLTGRRLGEIENAYAELTYVDNTTDNLILFFPNSQFTSKPMNIGAARIRGWEATAAADVTGFFHAALNYTRLDARDRSAIPFYNGNRLPSRPRSDLDVSLDASWRLWRLTYEWHHIASNFTDRANLVEVAARDLHNIIATWRLPVSGLSFTLEGRNLTDNRVSDVNGFPMPGRAVFTTLRYHKRQRR